MLFNLKTSLRRLLRKEDGSATFLIGLGTSVLIASTGIAIDMGRVQVVQSRLSSALDSAGLAAGNGVNSGNVNTITQKYFWANYPASYMGSNINNPTITANADNSILTLNVNGTVPTTFMRVFGIMSVPVQAYAQITRANMGMELVLVLDTTGSMADPASGGGSKMAAARNAATELVNILYGDETTIENLWIGLVPFAQAVNIGRTRGSWTIPGTFNWGPTTWSGCVDARQAGGNDVTDNPPSVALFPKYYWPCDGNNGWFGTNGGHNNCTPSGGGFAYNTPLSTSRGPNKACSQAVTPMNSSKATILSAISTLQPNGNTHINLGAVWAWRMLSPRWRNLWGGEMDTDQLPLDYDAPLMNKVVILMTDGDNTISNGSRGAYWYLSNGLLGTTNSTTATTILNTRTTQICNSMKNNGITVYTIAFGTDIGATAQSMLQNCATSPDFYFYSPTAASLSTAFQQIGDSLANLRVSQ